MAMTQKELAAMAELTARLAAAEEERQTLRALAGTFQVRDALAKAICAVMDECRGVEKGGTNEHAGYRFTSDAAVGTQIEEFFTQP